MSQDPDELVIRKFLGDPKKTEILAWLKGAGSNDERTLGEMDAEASVALAEEAYRAGASEVLAVDIVEFVREYVDGDVRVQNTGKLIIALPDDPAARKKIFRWQAKQVRSLGFEGSKDFGQRHLFVMLD
jgi:hypothetical protein